MYIFPERPAQTEESAWIERSLRIGDCFDVLLHNKAEFCPDAFDTLRRYGIDLKDNIYILVQFHSNLLWTADLLLQDSSVLLIDQIFAFWGSVFPLHLFTSDGNLYGLLFFQPPLQGERFQGQVRACCERLFSVSDVSDMSILISRDEQGTQGIFHAANSLRHAVDYLRFFNETPPYIFVNLKQQTSLGGGEELSTYRRLSQSIAERFQEPYFTPETSSAEILSTIKNLCPCSIDALHRQMQSFNLIFLEYLLTKGLIDDTFIRQQTIRQKIMNGDSCEEYLSNLSQTIHLLHSHYEELRSKYDLDRLNQVQNYVRCHISSPDLSVSDIADHFHVNRSQLTRQFRDYTGQSLAEYIHTSRLDLAVVLIESHPTRTIEQIAREAGYYSLSTMYRAFQKHGLTPPAQYQRKFLK